jgi:transposase-like protein
MRADIVGIDFRSKLWSSVWLYFRFALSYRNIEGMMPSEVCR